MKTLTIIIAVIISCLNISYSQNKDDFSSKNYISLQVNNHLEKRGTKGYSTGNPDMALRYERKIFTTKKNNFLIGGGTGFYREYVLTGYGWNHPDKNRFFIGVSPSYRIDFTKRSKIQINVLLDILLPDDFDETWAYFAIEPSYNFYFTKNLYAGVSATMGVFQFFTPKAYMDKAGIKIGFAF